MLSDRLRPDCEAAPWVIEEVKQLEELVAYIAKFPLEDFGHETKANDRQIFGANRWYLTVGLVKRARTLTRKASGDERCVSCPNPDEEGCPPGAITESCAMRMRDLPSGMAAMGRFPLK